MNKRLLPENHDYSSSFPHLSRRLRLGIVGGGRIASTQSMAARLSGFWEITAGALSSDPDRANRKAEQWYLDPGRSYSSYVEMANVESSLVDGIDAVMITTPNHLHFDPAIAFLDAGIDVLCDKPLTNDLGTARQLQKKVSSSNRIFGVSYTMSCFPMVRQAREIVASGEIGEINQIYVEFLQDWMVSDQALAAEHVQWRLDPERSGPTSCTGDIATHAAHLASFVSGLTLTELRAEMHVCGSPKPLEDTVIMMTKFGEVPGTLIATRMASGHRGGLRLRVFGSKGGIEWDMENAEQLRLSLAGEPDRVFTRGHGHGISSNVARLVRTGRGFSEGLIEAWANLYSEFAIAVAAKRDQITLPEELLLFPTIADGVAGVSFIEAAVKSNSLGGSWVSC